MAKIGDVHVCVNVLPEEAVGFLHEMGYIEQADGKLRMTAAAARALAERRDGVNKPWVKLFVDKVAMKVGTLEVVAGKGGYDDTILVDGKPIPEVCSLIVSRNWNDGKPWTVNLEMIADPRIAGSVERVDGWVDEVKKHNEKRKENPHGVTDVLLNEREDSVAAADRDLKTMLDQTRSVLSDPMATPGDKVSAVQNLRNKTRPPNHDQVGVVIEDKPYSYIIMDDPHDGEPMSEETVRKVQEWYDQSVAHRVQPIVVDGCRIGEVFVGDRKGFPGSPPEVSG
jgi:hypothetical protein